MQVADGDNKLKVGIHMYMPYVYVDTETHNRLRRFVLVAVHELSSDHIAVTDVDEGFLLINSWADVIDKNIRALRMVCASKARKCFHTPAEKKSLNCGRRRHNVNVGRRYKFLDIMNWDNDAGAYKRDERKYEHYSSIDDVFTDNKQEQKLVKRRAEFLMLTSLRKSDDDITAITLPQNIEDVEIAAGELDGAEPNEQEQDAKVRGVCDVLTMIIKQFVYQMGIVNDIDDIENVTAAGIGAFPSVYQVSLHQRWCFNHGKEHDSNRVYLLVRCFFLFFFLSLFAFASVVCFLCIFFCSFLTLLIFTISGRLYVFTTTDLNVVAAHLVLFMLCLYIYIFYYRSSLD